MLLTPLLPRAGPTGGLGLAWPAPTMSFTIWSVAICFRAIIKKMKIGLVVLYRSENSCWHRLEFGCRLYAEIGILAQECNFNNRRTLIECLYSTCLIEEARKGYCATRVKKKLATCKRIYLIKTPFFYSLLLFLSTIIMEFDHYLKLFTSD